VQCQHLADVGFLCSGGLAGFEAVDREVDVARAVVGLDPAMHNLGIVERARLDPGAIRLDRGQQPRTFRFPLLQENHCGIDIAVSFHTLPLNEE
jgi:hypothetical protein